MRPYQNIYSVVGSAGNLNMIGRDIETISARLDKIAEPLVQFGQTAAQLEGTNAIIQKMMGRRLACMGSLTAAGLFRIFLP